MLEVKREFRSRAHELIDYVRFTESVCNKKIVFRINGKPMDIQITRTKKASCYLLIYNLIESTARSAVQAIFDHI